VPTIRSYQPGDEAGIVSLFATVFQHELSLASWQWKYLRDGEPPPVYVAEEDGQIVCHYGALCQRLSWEGKVVLGWDIVDVMCHPRHQGRGLFRQAAQGFITQLCERRGALIYGFPGDRHRRLGERLIGYEPVAAVYKVQKRLAPTSTSFPAGIVVLRTIPPEWDQQWSVLERRFGFVTRRDRQLLSWRYEERPGKRYRFLTIPGVPALAVVGCESEKAYLMEFVLEEGNTAAAQLLLLAVESLCSAEGATTLEGWFARFAWECEFLIGRGGFTGVEADTYFECRVFDPCLRAAWLAEHFYYSLGDYDVF
jgi:hypothetical protein